MVTIFAVRACTTNRKIKALLDKKRVYEITLGQFPNGSIARWIGFPKQDPAHYGIVTNAETDQAFSTAKVGPIKLGP